LERLRSRWKELDIPGKEELEEEVDLEPEVRRITVWEIAARVRAKRDGASAP
jgi:hypothetical protein